MSACAANIVKTIFVILAFIAPLKANDNNIYFELCGSGWFYSINYERIFAKQFSGRIGFCSFYSINTIPFMLNYFIGSGNHRCETGLGFTYVYADPNNGGWMIRGGSNQEVHGTLYLGYRYQPKENGLIFRIGFSPTISFTDKYYWASAPFMPWGEISVGYSF